MSSWSEISEKNLFSFSKEQSDFEIALEEWAYTGALVDHFFPIETCQLCEHANLRYHFEIINRETGMSMQVGSSCIEHFGIRVYDKEGNELKGKDRQKQLGLEIKTKKDKLVYASLLALWKTSDENREKVTLCTRDYQEKGKFPPRNLLYLFQQMNEKGIDYVPHIFKVTLRSKADQEDLHQMSIAERELIWGSLSTTQKKSYLKRKKAFGEKLKQESSVQQKTPVDHSLPEMPIRYSERAHRYKITFFDADGKPVKRLFRGKLNEARTFIRGSIVDSPIFAKAEIRMTETNQLLETHP